MRRPAQLRLFHSYPARCPGPRQRGKAPIRPRVRDMDRELCLWEFALARDQMGAASINRATPARVRAQLKCSSRSAQTFPLEIFAPAREYLSDSLSACDAFSNHFVLM